jgi:hypothetical protein
MKFSIEKSIEILERTPGTLEYLLIGLDREWIMSNEGPDTWSSFDVVGHLVHAEHTNWIPRMEIVLSNGEQRQFTPFDRFAQLRNNKDRTLVELMDEFKSVRRANIALLRAKGITADDLLRTAIHPEFGAVTLAQLLATWAVHDLTHLAQITRVMAKQYKEAVGPWKQYLSVLKG